MNDQNFTIQPMTRDDLDIAIDWAAQEGWNPGKFDGDCYFKADPTGFLMGFLGDTPIASISLVKYKGNFAFLGFYIVAPHFRGKGYGLKLWTHAMDTVKGFNVALDGVTDQQDNYKKSGFKLAFANIRFQGTGGGSMPDTPEIIPLDKISRDQFLTYDQPFFPGDRAEFISSWITQPGSSALGFIQRDKLTGYGVIRECKQGHKIGPLFANTPDQALALFQALKSRVAEGDPIFLDIPETNPQAMALVQSHNMVPAFETARMYTGPFPDLPMEKIFGITSFEVG